MKMKRWSELSGAPGRGDHPDLFTEYATSANWFWNDQGQDGHPPVYQIAWPGARDGLFPWEEGCAEEVITAQPQLWSKPIP